MDKETLRMQMLSGVITESEYKAKLNEAEEAQAIATAEKIEADVEKAPSVKDALNKLSDEEKDQLRAKLTKAGITADSRIEDVAGELDESLTEAEGDTKQKVANVLSVVGGGIMKSMIVPLIPLIVGKITGTGFIGGTAITAGAAGALIGLAKLLDAGEAKNSLNEHYVAGGIVGIGAINQIPSRAKADYEDAFEHFLGQKYSLNEMGDDMPEAPSHKETDAAQVYEANPLEGGPGHMTKYRIGVISTLISDAEKDLIKYKESSFFTPELIEKMKGTIERLKSTLEDLKAQYREETGKDVKEAEEPSLYEAESPTKEEIAAFEAAVEQLMDMTGMSLEDATMAIGRAANAKTK